MESLVTGQASLTDDVTLAVQEFVQNQGIGGVVGNVRTGR